MRISAPQLIPQYITVSNSCQAENKKKAHARNPLCDKGYRVRQ